MFINQLTVDAQSNVTADTPVSITDVFNERRWFRIYVGDPDSWDSNGEPVFNTGNPGWGLYQFHFYIRLENLVIYQQEILQPPDLM